jgi:hypothetical protein
VALFDEKNPPENLSSAVHQAVGAASMCWENPGGAGQFLSNNATAVARDLIAYIETHYLPKGEYTTEVGGAVFTQAQWEAVQGYITARLAQGTTVTVDGAIDTPDVLKDLS